MTTFTDLPVDIIHKILILVPDKRTLLTAILTSTCFYVVYEQHPQTILRSTCCDRSCFVQALRVAQNVLTLAEMEMVMSFLKDVCLWLNTANDVNMAPPTGDEDYSNYS